MICLCFEDKNWLFDNLSIDSYFEGFMSMAHQHVGDHVGIVIIIYLVWETHQWLGIRMIWILRIREDIKLSVEMTIEEELIIEIC